MLLHENSNFANEIKLNVNYGIYTLSYLRRSATMEV